MGFVCGLLCVLCGDCPGVFGDVEGGMKKKYCRECMKETWQNPLKEKNEYRCTQCGFPRRGGQKHVAKIAGVVRWFGKEG